MLQQAPTSKRCYSGVGISVLLGGLAIDVTNDAKRVPCMSDYIYESALPFGRLIPFKYASISRFRRMTTLLQLALLLMALEFVGLFSGHTIHQKNTNALSALAHLGGFLATLSMILNGWTVRVYPYMFTLFRYGNLQIYIHTTTVLSSVCELVECKKSPEGLFGHVYWHHL